MKKIFLCGAGIAVLTTLYIYSLFINLEHRIRGGLALMQVSDLMEWMQEGMSSQDSEEISKRIEWVEIYYSSGSKQRAGTKLDRIVETVRSNCVYTLKQRMIEIEEVNKR